MAEQFIVNYEPYVVGLKIFQGFDLTFIEKNTKDALKSSEFEIPNPLPSMPVKVAPFYELLGFKNNVEVRLNRQTGSFNIFGDNPENVLEITKEFPDILKKANYDIARLIEFYELNENIIAQTGENPRKVLKKSANIDLDVYSTLKAQVVGFKISSVDNEEKKLINIIIEPRAGNPENMYYIGVVYRTEQLEDLIEFGESSEENLKQIINSLESNDD